jgi:hypothetical protein
MDRLDSGSLVAATIGGRTLQLILNILFTKQINADKKDKGCRILKISATKSGAQFLFQVLDDAFTYLIHFLVG